MPAEWKFSIVLPLYKNKGKMNDCNNYKGISLLSPIGKNFEMILARQVEQYFELNELFHPSQHGFRKNYSCETRNCQLTFGKLSRIKYYHVKWTINNSLVKLISNFKLNTKN